MRLCKLIAWFLQFFARLLTHENGLNELVPLGELYVFAFEGLLQGHPSALYVLAFRVEHAFVVWVDYDFRPVTKVELHHSI